jgi:hypothetical protein
MRAEVHGSGDAQRDTAAKPYVNVAELAKLTPWSEQAIRSMIARGTFRRGVHYFQPGGRRGQLVFRWDAVVRYIEGEPGPEGIPLADGTVIDLEEAQKHARRLLG